MNFSRIAVIGCVVAGLVISSFAAEEAATAAPAKAAKTTKSAPAKAAALKANGTIESVDAIGNTVVVKEKTASTTFKVDSTTKILISGKAAVIGDLKAGTAVNVSYKDNNGEKVAVSIKEKVAKAAPAKEPKAAAPAAK